MRTRHRTSALLAALLLLALAVLVRLGVTTELDLAGIRAAQSLASDPLDILANGHTAIGQVIPTVIVAAVFAAILWQRGHGLVSLAPLLILATGAIELGLKLVTAHPPPGEEYVRAFMNPLGVRFPTPSAFPSGHVARLTFLALLVAALVPVASLRVAAALLVAMSLFLRVYIGDHWPTDVIGGAVLGLAFAVPAAAWVRRIRR